MIQQSIHQQSKDTLFSTIDGINYSNGAFSINDSSIISNSLLVWDQGFKSVDLPANSGRFINGVLSFSDLFTIDDTVGMGIGIDPTQSSILMVRFDCVNILLIRY